MQFNHHYSTANRTARLITVLTLVLSSYCARAIEFSTSPGPHPYGLATDGTTIWHSDFEDSRIYALNSTGSVTSSFPFTHGRPRGLAYNAGQLFVATWNRIYIVNASTGADISNFASPDTSSPDHQGLAYGDGKLWIASRGTDDRIYSVNPATGAPTANFSTPGTNPRGLTYHSGSLWNLDSSDDEIHEINPLTGAVLNSSPIPLNSPRGLTVFGGKFILADNLVDAMMGFDTSNDFSSVFIAPHQLPIAGSPGSMFLPIMRSQPLDQSDAGIRRILVFQHGIGDVAVDHFARANHAAELAGVADETLIVALQLLDDDKLTSAPPASMIYWTGSRFWGGRSASGSAPYPRSERFSSFAILDELLTTLTANSAQFPNLSEIVISGHSGGGQFSNRYSAFSPFENSIAADPRQISMSYIVMNPSSYVYFDDRRFDPATLDLANNVVDFVVPQPTPNYNSYGYGLANLWGYPATTGSTNALSDYPERRVVILLGENDTGTADLDTSAAANLQGANRLERGQIYHRHLQDVFGAASLPYQRLATVPAIGHWSFGMITSANGLRYHFRTEPDIGVSRLDPLTPLVDDASTVNFAATEIGVGSPVTFSIENHGASELNGLAATVVGQNASMFQVGAIGATTLGDDESTTLGLTFTPTSRGSMTATLRITSNDPDKNPFDIALIGAGAGPEIEVEQPASNGLTDGANTVQFGSVYTTQQSQRQFTIRNTGNATMTGLAASFAGLHTVDYSAGTFGATSLNPGQSTTVTVTFAPTSGGVRSAVLRIASNDSDENPFDVGLSGLGIDPEITVEQPVGVGLVDGASAIAFGEQQTGTTPSRTVTIRNSGTTVLTGLAVTFDGANPSDFSSSVLSANSLNPGQTATFTITLNAGAAGERAAAAHIASNDLDENPFDVALTANVIDPEISVEQPVATALVDGASTINFGSIAPVQTVNRTVTIRNSGTTVLTGLAASVDGPHAGDYSAGIPGATSLSPGQTTTFNVSFTAGAAGTRTAAVHITSNDADENPFDIILSAVSLDPEIAVEQPVDVDIPDGGARGFGAVNLGEDRTNTYTIRNLGTQPLTGLSMNISGDHAAEFSATALPDTTLAAGSAMTFDVTFTPIALEVRNAAIAIASNDRDENPFDILISGVGATPEIAVEQPVGIGLTDGSALVDFGDAPIDGSVPITFRIRNLGTGPLSGLALSLTGAQAGEFKLGALSGADLSSGGARSFTVSFTPTALGIHTATLQIASNDADENPFEISLTGNARAPEIQVFTDGVEIQSGANVVLDDLVGDSQVSRTLAFQIRNDGPVDLLGLNNSVSGTDAAEFNATTLNGGSLPPGQTLPFTITLIPVGNGERSAAVQIASNDLDENPFVINVSGSRLAVASIDDFADEHGLIGADRQPTSDADGDGLTLVEEYAYNLDPTIADAQIMLSGGTSGLPLITLEDLGDGEHRLRVEMIQRRNDPALTYEIEFDSSISGLAPALNGAINTSIDDNYKRSVIVDSETTATESQRFSRAGFAYQSAP